MDENTVTKPFSRSFVVNVTIRNMRKSVDISIKKTLKRVGEFSQDREKSQEILETLSCLYSIQKQLDSIKIEENKNEF
jgi:hypothetical protein